LTWRISFYLSMKCLKIWLLTEACF